MSHVLAPWPDWGRPTHHSRLEGEVLVSTEREMASLAIARSERVMLRRWLATDADHFLRSFTQGQWLLFDAPWDESIPWSTAEEERTGREWFMRQLDRGHQSYLGRRLVIALPDGTPIGRVNRYGEGEYPGACFVGIAICEDEFLNRGLGTAALKLWVDHLFASSELHKLCLDTWSFNPRMIRVAEKVGFVCEGRRREMLYWQGQWLDLVHFGILREECEVSG